ncbi:hypothetical protein SAMN06264364_11853 [Quadrisphaera granulorum]|uniref:Uncharacterized protein n=1 Tax=Quadrisphaera granulorum TaxID=317664 RepID=A0A316A5C8_9ACTN|nr:hypothetical protein [Quadrisphaera granulorum]PWJ52682.1 hypothetical protein BXY45_11853 [Quadrisphaera granulorum]SZE97504.1 hypothetical protein SAMN06264364_11853 [Quadrisphaera granulorum]
MTSGRPRSTNRQPFGNDALRGLDDELDDLDDAFAAHEEKGDDESGPPTHRLRLRLLAVGVLVVVALLGAALGTAHANARAAQAERTLRLDTALRTGEVTLDGSISTVGALSLASASVPLVNSSAQAVSAQLVELDAPHLGKFSLSGSRREAPVPVRLAPGSALSVQAAVETQCDDVPAPDPYGGIPTAVPAPAAVVVEVAPGDGDPSHRVRLPLAADEAQQLADALVWACHPDSGSGMPQTSFAWLPDGRLRVDLAYDFSAGAPVKITARTSGGVEVTSSPPLPLLLAPGDEQQVVVTAHVDCSAAGDGFQSAVVLSSEAVVDGGAAQGTTIYDLSSGSSGDGTPYGTSGWLMRQIALTCG